jgi:hypothetical protein
LTYENPLLNFNTDFKKERRDIYEPPVWAKIAFIWLISLALVILELVAIIVLISAMATLGVITGIEVTVKVIHINSFFLHFIFF